MRLAALLGFRCEVTNFEGTLLLSMALYLVGIYDTINQSLQSIVIIISSTVIN